MLKKISSLAGGGHHAGGSAGDRTEPRRKSVDGGSAGGRTESRRKSLDGGSGGGRTEQRRKSLDGGRPSRRPSEFRRESSPGEQGTRKEADDLRNAMQILSDENKVLKGLIEEHNRAARRSLDSFSSDRDDQLEALRAQCDEAEDEAAELRRELQSKDTLISSMKSDPDTLKAEEVQKLKDKIRSLEAQLEFECRSHAEELQEKEARVAELETQLLAIQQGAGEGGPLLQDNEATEARNREVAELKKKVADQAAELSRKDAELQEAQAMIEGHAARRAQPDLTGAEQEVKDLRRRIDVLEKQLKEAERKLSEAEQALALHRAAAGESETASKALQELRNEMQAKDDALQGMSQQLLEVSAEKDELAQELQKLREGPSAPETPRTLTSKRSFFGRSKSTALERDALAAQVQQLEEQLQKLTERRVELERTKVKLEGQLTEAAQDARSARAEKSTVEAKLREREAVLESLRSIHADMKRPLDVPGTVVLPMPTGSQDATYEAKAQLTLKEGVIKTLSARVAFLQFALDEVQAEKEKLLAEPAAVALRQQLEDTKKELAETSTERRNVAAQCSSLSEKVKALTAEVAGARREITTLQAALEEAQTRLAAAADKYKNENDRYCTIVSTSLSRIEELQDEVTRERTSKILTSKICRQEALELRKAAVLAGCIHGDPVRPLSLRKAACTEKSQQTEQPSEHPSEKPPEASMCPPPLAQPLCHNLLPPLAKSHTEAASCLFSRGIPVLGRESQTDMNFATIPLCYPVKLTPRPEDVRDPATSAPTGLTVGQRRGVGTQQDHFEQRQQDQQRNQELPSPSNTTSPARSGVDVEAPFSPCAMKELQQQPQLLSQVTQQLPNAQQQGQQEQRQKEQCNRRELQQQLPNAQQQQEQQQQEQKQRQQHHQQQLPSTQQEQQQQSEQKRQQHREQAQPPQEKEASEAPQRSSYFFRESSTGGEPILTSVLPSQESLAKKFSSLQDDYGPRSQCSAVERRSTSAHRGIELDHERQNQGVGVPAALPSYECLRAPSLVNEATVVRDLQMLQQKTKVLFTAGMGSRDSRSEPDGENVVDLS